MKNTSRDLMFDIHTHTISLINIGYDILTPVVIKDHWRSQEVKMRSNMKNVPMDQMLCKYAHMISTINIGYDYLTPEVIRGSWRSQEVTFERCTQGPNFWHVYPCNIPDLQRIWYFDPKIDVSSKKVKEVKGSSKS